MQYAHNIFIDEFDIYNTNVAYIFCWQVEEDFFTIPDVEPYECQQIESFRYYH